MPKGIYEHKRGYQLSREGRAAIATAKRGAKNPNWRGGRKIDRQGYILVLAPEHPKANAEGYVYEHRLVMEGSLGRMLCPVEVVHHINGKHDDNREANLVLCNNRSCHQDVHRGDVYLPC